MKPALQQYIANGIAQKFAELVKHKFISPEYGSHEIDAYSEWESEDNQAADDDIDHALNEYYEAVDSGRGVDEAKANAGAALERYQSHLTGESRNKAGNEPRYDDPEQVNDIVNAIGQAIQDPEGGRVSVDEAKKSSGTASDERGAAAEEAKKKEQDEEWANRPYAEDWRVEEAAAQIEAEKKGIVDEELEREMEAEAAAADEYVQQVGGPQTRGEGGNADALGNEVEFAIAQTGQDMGDMTPEQVREAIKEAIPGIYDSLEESGDVPEFTNESYDDFSNALDAYLEKSHGGAEGGGEEEADTSSSSRCETGTHKDPKTGQCKPIQGLRTAPDILLREKSIGHIQEKFIECLQTLAHSSGR